MKALLKRAGILLAAKREEIGRKRRIRELRQESELIFQEAMGRVICQKPNGGTLAKEAADDEVYSV